MKMKNLRTDSKKEIEGVWVDIDDGGKLKIARANNLAYLAMYRELTKPFWGQMRTSGSLSIEKHIEVVTKCLSETVLVDWEGIEDGNPPVPVPYSKEKAYEFLSTVADFRELVTRFSDQQFRYRDEDLEEAIKN